MRISLEISGHSRTYEYSYYLFKSRLLDILNKIGQVDIFISTWNKISTKNCWASVSSPEKNISNRIDNDIDENKIFELYNPKKIEIEDSINAKIFEGKPFMFPMFYKIQKCNELKKEYEKQNNFKYDVVVRWRFDIYPQSEFDTKPLENLNVLYCEYMQTPGTCGDVMWVTNSEIMDKVADLYSNLNTYLKDGPEKTLYAYVSDLKIPMKEYPTKVSFLRENEIGNFIKV